MISVTLWVFVAVAALAYFLLKPKQKDINLPGPRGLPVLGNLLQLEKNLWVVFNKWSMKYGPMCKARLGSLKFIIVSDNKLAKEMLAMDVFVGRATVKAFQLFEGEAIGLINNEGESWEEQRRFVVRQLRDLGFGKTSMESMMMDEINELVERLGKYNGKSVDNVKNVISLALINSLWRIVAGTRYSQEDPKLRKLLHQLSETFDEAAKSGGLLAFADWIKYVIPEWSGYNQIRRAMQGTIDFVSQTISEHKKTHQEDSPRDFIDVYLSEIKKTKKSSSSFYGAAGEKQLIGVVSDFFQAGTDTTSVTLHWAFLHLMKQPEIQRKLQTEIETVTGNNRPVSFSDRSNMPYALAVVSELLRISIVPFGAPHQVLRDTEFKGVFIPKGTGIFINMYYIHHDPKVWDNPDDFRPERFLAEDGKTLKNLENLNAFLVGRRQCPGEMLARDSVFLFLTNILQKFDILEDPNSPADLEPAVSFTNQAKPYRAIFRERQI